MVEFESQLLKNLIYNSEYFSKVMPILKSSHFSEIGTQELFKLISEYYGEYRERPSLEALVVKVKNVPNAQVRSEIISSLKAVNTTDEIQNVEFMCNETISWVKDALYYLALQTGSDGLMKKDDSLKLKAQKIMDERAKVSIDTDLGLDFDDIDTMIQYYSERMIGIKTQHNELNKRLGPGFLPGTLSVILSPSGVGKSLMMTDFISGLIKNNKNILLVSLEMADKEIMKRVHANAMDLPINSLIDLAKTPPELDKLDRPYVTKQMIIDAYNKVKLSGTCGKLFIKDYPSGSFSPLMLEQLVDSYRIEQNIEFDIVFVDYLGIMKSDLLTPSAGLYSYVKSIAEETRAVAKKLNVAIISASQLNRSATNNIDDADNSNVSDSMGTVMTADFMMFLLQDEKMKERKEIVCKITKNRFGGVTDTWRISVDYEHMRFSDQLVQENDLSNIDITNTLGLNKSQKLSDDFAILTVDRNKEAEKYATAEIKSIVREDVRKIIQHDKDKKDPFCNDIESLYKELGI